MKGILAAGEKIASQDWLTSSTWKKNALKIFLVLYSNIIFPPLLLHDFLSTHNFLMSSIWRLFTHHDRAFDDILLAKLKPESSRALSTSCSPWFKHYVWRLKETSIVAGLRCSGFCSKCRFCTWRNSTQCLWTLCFPFTGKQMSNIFAEELFNSKILYVYSFLDMVIEGKSR